MKNVLSRTLAAFLRPLVEVRPGERMKTFLMFSYFFLTIATIYVLKPVRSSLFLEELGAQNLRYVYMGEGLFLIFVVAAYVQLARRVTKKKLYDWVLGFFASHLILFWLLFRVKLPYLSAIFYIWVASFSITMTTQFWILANDIFSTLEAKRLFGLIISGGSAGGIIGGVLTHQLAQRIETEDLLLVAAVLLLGCLMLVGALWKATPLLSTSPHKRMPGKGKKAALEETHNQPLLKIFLSTPYLFLLVGLVVIAKMSSTIVDNQFNKVVELAVAGKEARTAFFGGFMAWLNALSFFMQLFLTSLALRYLGVSVSLAILPIGLALFTLLGFLQPVVLLTGLALKLFDGSVNYSVQQAGKEVLFLPLSSALRYRVKPVIDMLGFRAAKSLGGLYIALAAPLLGLADEKLGLLVLILIPFWAFLLWQLKKGYSELLRSHLFRKLQEEKPKSSHRISDLVSRIEHGKSIEELKPLVHHSSSFVRKLAATAFLAYARAGKDARFARQITQEMVLYESIDGSSRPSERLRRYLKKQPARALEKLRPLFKNGRAHSRFLQRAARLLGELDQEGNAEFLLQSASASQDHGVRWALLRALGRLQEKNSKPVLSRSLLKKEIIREAHLHMKLHKLSAMYRHHLHKAKAGEDYFRILLAALCDENVERLFGFLSLLYPQEGIREIYLRIVAKGEDPLRHHALELLSNTLEPDLLIWVQQVLEGRETVRLSEREIVEILRSFIRSEDRWYSFVSFFLISELGLYERWPGLARLRGDSDFKRASLVG